jgi:hypothetical protein
VWVPLVAAAAGVVAGLVTGLGGAILTRRWGSQDRREQWLREDSQRWLKDRLQTYARLVSALDEWEGVIVTATVKRRVAAVAGDQPSFDAGAWDHARDATNDVLALVELTAPENVRGRARSCYVAHDWIRHGFLTAEGADLAEMDAARTKAAAIKNALIEAMRADVGLADTVQPPQSVRWQSTLGPPDPLRGPSSKPVTGRDSPGAIPPDRPGPA